MPNEFPDHGELMDKVIGKMHANYWARVELALERWLSEGVCVYLVHKPISGGGGCDVVQNKTDVVLEHIPPTKLVLTNAGQ